MDLPFCTRGVGREDGPRGGETDKNDIEPVRVSGFQHKDHYPVTLKRKGFVGRILSGSEN